MEQFVIFLVVGAIALLKWLAKSAGSDATRNTPSASGPSKRREETESEEVRMRRFMEALGVPPGSVPPRTQPRRLRTREEIIEQQRKPQAQPPARKAAPPQLPRKLVPAPVPEPARAPMPLAEPEWAAPVLEKVQAEPVLEFSTPRNDVAALLKSRAGLRDAFVLREILGLPRGLQSPF